MSDEKDRPKLTVVAENTRQQVDANIMQEQVDYALRELAANIIRVVRGAGRPDDIIDQCNEVLKAAIEYHDKTQRFVPYHSVAAALRLEREEIDDYHSYFGQRKLAIRRMVKGSLQIAASSLLKQLTQIHMGESELDDGYRELESLCEERRKQREAEARASRVAATPKRKSTAKKARKPKKTIPPIEL